MTVPADVSAARPDLRSQNPFGPIDVPGEGVPTLVAIAPLSDAPPSAEPARATASAFVRDVIALTKPRITLLVIITMVGGMGLAKRVSPGTDLSLSKAFFALLGTVLVVSGASAFNMYLERDTDALMERTRRRPLPTGRLGPNVALAVGSVWGDTIMIAAAATRARPWCQAA